MFSTNLSTRSCDGRAVVALRGELDLADAVAVAEALTAVAVSQPQVIVDLAGLEFIDSSGVAALARGRRQAWQGGGDLVLVAPQREVMLALALIRLSDAFRVYATVEEAACEAETPRERALGVAVWRPAGATGVSAATSRLASTSWALPPRVGPGLRTWSGLWGLPARFPRRIRAVSRPDSPDELARGVRRGMSRTFPGL